MSVVVGVLVEASVAAVAMVPVLIQPRVTLLFELLRSVWIAAVRVLTTLVYHTVVPEVVQVALVVVQFATMRRCLGVAAVARLEAVRFGLVLVELVVVVVVVVELVVVGDRRGQNRKRSLLHLVDEASDGGNSCFQRSVPKACHCRPAACRKKSVVVDPVVSFPCPGS